MRSKLVLVKSSVRRDRNDSVVIRLLLGFMFFCFLVFGYDFMLFLVLLLAVFKLIQIVLQVHFLGCSIADFGLPF